MRLYMTGLSLRETAAVSEIYKYIENTVFEMCLVNWTYIAFETYQEQSGSSETDRLYTVRFPERNNIVNSSVSIGSSLLMS